MTRVTALICVSLATAVTALACGSPPPTIAKAQHNEAPGAVVATDALPTIDGSIQPVAAWGKRIKYVSRSGINDSQTHVTGSLFVPRGNPPNGGWPIAVYAHSLTGSKPDCAPSLTPNLLGAADAVAVLLKDGYVVAVPDYQGLGNLGPDRTYHPYLDSATVGYNLIDSVRAVRELVPETSNQWVALGTSQGGQAAWAANELADDYGGGLKMLGSVSFSPITDINGLADAAVAGELTKEQQLALIGFLAATKTEYPGEFNLDDYRRGIVKEKWDALLACQDPTSAERAMAADQITADDLRPSGDAALAMFRGFLQKTSLPQGPTQVPMLVVYGGHDSVTPRAWTERALDRACKLGDVIQIQPEPDNINDQIDPSIALGWIADRFNSRPARDDCASFTASYESSEQRPGSG